MNRQLLFVNIEIGFIIINKLTNILHKNLFFQLSFQIFRWINSEYLLEFFFCVQFHIISENIL